MSTDTDDLLTVIDGAVARITFNRPDARNAINRPMLVKLAEFVTQIATDDAVRCVVLTGAGDHFMAGGDVAGFGEVLDQSPEERRADFSQRPARSNPVLINFRSMPKPVIARVRGACAGAAIGYAAGCDFVVGDESCLFVASHVLIGLSSDGGLSYALPRRIGEARATKMCMLGERMAAQEALNTGLLDMLVPAAELDEAVESLVGRLLALPTSSLRNIKRLMKSSLANSLEEQLDLEAELFGDCSADPNFIEGVSAFLEKRKAEFNKG